MKILHIQKISKAKKGILVSDKVKEAMRMGRQNSDVDPYIWANYGEKNGMTKKIGVYDQDGLLIHVSPCKFHKFCKENILPYDALVLCYKNLSVITYVRHKSKYGMYIGWYAREM